MSHRKPRKPRDRGMLAFLLKPGDGPHGPTKRRPKPRDNRTREHERETSR